MPKKNNTNNNNTTYDDVFRTLINDCTDLIIPVVNELFHEHYSEKDSVKVFHNEFFIRTGNEEIKERITDSHLEVKPHTTKVACFPSM